MNKNSQLNILRIEVLDSGYTDQSKTDTILNYIKERDNLNNMENFFPPIEAIKIVNKHNEIIAVSKKWKNILFNTKELFLEKIIPLIGAVSIWVIEGKSLERAVSITLATLGVVYILSESKNIDLSNDEALIMLILASISFRGRPINTGTYELLKKHADDRHINLEKVLSNLRAIKAISYNDKTKEIYVTEKIIIEA